MKFQNLILLVVIFLVACSNDSDSDSFSPIDDGQNTDPLQTDIEPKPAQPDDTQEESVNPESIPVITEVPAVVEAEEEDCGVAITANDPSGNEGSFGKQLSGAENSVRQSLQQTVANHVINDIKQTRSVFNWNDANDQVVCQAIGLTNGLITLGVDADEETLFSFTTNLNSLLIEIDSFQNSIEVVSINKDLGTLQLNVSDCMSLAAVRSHPTVAFIDVPYSFPLKALYNTQGENLIRSTLAVNCPSQPRVPILDELSAETDYVLTTDYNPSLHQQISPNSSYVDFVSLFDPHSAIRAKHHNLNDVYEQYDAFGQGIGVTVIDNGILEEDIAYLNTGNGGFQLEGYFSGFEVIPTGKADGVSPKTSDFLGVPARNRSLIGHGTQQSKRLYHLAPESHRVSARGSSFIMMVFSWQLRGTVQALMAQAENPHINIVSLSLASLTYSAEISRAIDILNSRGKIVVAPAGTSAPIIRDLFDVVFPANLPSTISATGIKDTNETNGVYKLGDTAHGGVENDFVIDDAETSSSAVSSLSAMTAVLWSINPALPAAKLKKVMTESSEFYLSQDIKDPVFGWGKVDMKLAADTIRNTVP